MKQVNELYAELVAGDGVRSIRRYNLRRLCRSLDLPPCGISFFEIEDVSWDQLRALNEMLVHERYVFRGGETFPHSFFADIALGSERRLELIFLMTGEQHLAWRVFMERAFGPTRRDFGSPRANAAPLSAPSLAAHFHRSLLADLIQLSQYRDPLPAIAELSLCLWMLTHLDGSAVTRDEIFAAFEARFPHLRPAVSRIRTTTDLTDRLDDMLDLMSSQPDQ